mmetsp:Transcript_23501/g.32172  ORF Transcript_23501/g.32172 Transcript_23501/m.32172 type:complete len:210 (-) Transcript_23501:5059-5688(-)
MDFFRLANSRRPSLMPTTMDAKLSSSSTISAASRATSLPLSPMATPMAACFKAGESFTPSPVMAVTLPALVNSFTMISFCSGEVRAKTISCLETSTFQSASVMAGMSDPLTTTARTSSSGTSEGAMARCRASRSLVGCVMRPILRAMAAAVSGWSPVTITTLTPAVWQSAMAFGTSRRGGSCSVTSPTKTRSLAGLAPLPMSASFSSSL